MMTKVEFLQELDRMGGDLVYTLDDLRALSDVVVYHDIHSGQVFIHLANDLGVAPCEPTPLYGARFNVDMAVAVWGDRTKVKANLCIIAHHCAINFLTKVVEKATK